MPPQITPREEVQFQQSDVFWLCESSCENDKNRDHDHLTGRYQGAAETKCNLNCK